MEAYHFYIIFTSTNKIFLSVFFFITNYEIVGITLNLIWFISYESVSCSHNYVFLVLVLYYLQTLLNLF